MDSRSSMFLFRMFAVKNSMNRHEARSPAPMIATGRVSKPARVTWRGLILAISLVMDVELLKLHNVLYVTLL